MKLLTSKGEASECRRQNGAAGPRVWNSQTEEIGMTRDYTFRTQSKINLFNLNFPSNMCSHADISAQTSKQKPSD